MRSCRYTANVDRLRNALRLLDIVSDSPEGKSVGLRLGVPLCSAVGHCTGNLWYFCDPAAVRLPFGFDVELQGLAPCTAGWFAISHPTLSIHRSRVLLRMQIQENICLKTVQKIPHDHAGREGPLFHVKPRDGTAEAVPFPCSVA
jgi:hypothetical protein